MNSTVEYKKLINGKGFYAKVDLDASSSSRSGGLEFSFDKSSKWYHTVFFAVNYYFEHLKRQGQKELTVKVNMIEEQIIDTGHIVVIYVILSAIEKALGKSIIDFKIDEKGNLSLPK